jgi:hypothetical protein
MLGPTLMELLDAVSGQQKESRANIDDATNLARDHPTLMAELQMRQILRLAEQLERLNVTIAYYVAKTVG